jgi:hypothetical protein
MLIFLTLFSAFSIGGFYLFITIKTVKLSRDCIRFSFFALPFHRTYLLSDLKRISQTSKDIQVSKGFSTPLSVKYIITVFELSDGKKIKVNSIGIIDYEELVKCFNKITRGNGQYSPPRGRFFLYFLDSFEGLGLVVMTIILTIGLAWDLLNR